MTTGDARFVELYEAYFRRIYAYCRRRIPADSVDDAVADVFLTAWRKIDQMPDEFEALPWLYAVAHRVVGHQWRGSSRQGRLRKKLESIGLSHVVPPDEVLIVDQESERILEALSHLRLPEQEVLRLHVWEELRHQDIAEVLGISLDAVKQRFSRAKKNLANEFNRLEARTMSSPAAQKGGAW